MTAPGLQVDAVLTLERDTPPVDAATRRTLVEGMEALRRAADAPTRAEAVDTLRAAARRADIDGDALAASMAAMLRRVAADMERRT